MKEPLGRKKAILCILLVLAFIGAYFNSLDNGFVYDDYPFILNNSFIRSLGNLGAFFSSKFSTSDTGHSLYRPLRTLSFAVDYRLHGLDPSGYHVTNAVIHTLNSLLVFLLCRAVLGGIYAPFIAALFWTLHPVHTETVAWVSSRGDLLSAFFFIGSMLLMIKRLDYAESGPGALRAPGLRQAACYSCAFLLFCFSMLSKESAAVLPLVFAAYAVVLRKAGGAGLRRVIAGLAPFFLAAALYFVVRGIILGGVAQGPYWGSGPWSTFCTMLTVFAKYMRLLVFPVGLCVEYTVRIRESFFEPQVVFSLAVLLLAVYAALSSAKLSPVLPFSALWFGINLLPVSNIIPIGGLMNEHFLYLPSMGFCWVAAFLIKRYLLREDNRVLTKALAWVMVLCVAGNCLVMTARRNRDWKDALTLWYVTAVSHPESFRAHINLGFEYNKKGYYRAAISEFQRGLALKPHNSSAHNNMGVAYLNLEDFELAQEEFETAVKLDPENADAVLNLGVASTKKGKLDDALRFYERAAAMKPGEAAAYYNRGIIRYEKRRHADAIKEYEKAIELNPFLPSAYYNIGKLYQEAGEMEKAVYYYQKAISQKEDYAEAHNNLGSIYMERNMHNEAAGEFETAARLEPGRPEFLSNLGGAYARSGRVREALGAFLMALDADSTFSEARYNLAMLYLAQGKKDLAGKELSRIGQSLPQE